jgi:hypothetical protein
MAVLQLRGHTLSVKCSCSPLTRTAREYILAPLQTHAACREYVGSSVGQLSTAASAAADDPHRTRSSDVLQNRSSTAA